MGNSGRVPTLSDLTAIQAFEKAAQIAEAEGKYDARGHWLGAEPKPLAKRIAAAIRAEAKEPPK